MQTYKIYINDRPLILAEGNNILDFPSVPDAHLITLYQGNKRFLLNYVDALEKGGRFDAITLFYPDFEKMKADFANAGMTRFGSGWAWLSVKADKTLCVCSTPNQDNPLMPNVGCSGFPILGLDVWEHAYYLNYQNRRPDYIQAFFNVINWEVVETRYNSAK
jgi:superoxide dismutase